MLASTGPAVQVGYQGQWTDPGTGQVSMGARFYKPGQGSFINQDAYVGAQGGAAVAGNLHAYANDNPMTITDVSGHSPSASSSAGSVSLSQVTAAAARAGEARAKAVYLEGEAKTAALGAATVEAGAHTAANLAHRLNSAAAKLAQKASRTTQEAAAAFDAARAQLQSVKAWQDKDNAEWREAKDQLSQSHGLNPISDLEHFKNSVKDGAIALWDERRVAAAGLVWLRLEGKANSLKMLAGLEDGAAHLAAELAKGAAKAAEIADKLADVAVESAKTLAAEAGQAEAEAAQDQAEAGALGRAYAKELAHKVTKVARAIGRVVKKAAKAVGRAAVVAAKAAYKYSGAQDVVSCVTDPTVAGCVKAAITVALVVGTAGEGEVAEIGLNAAEHVGEDVAEEAGGNALKDAGESCVLGGESFTAATKVLLANGKAVAIASLQSGEKVLATNTKTGKTQAEAISAVLVHHDTDLYDLRVKTGTRVRVIHTTSNHLFWDAHLKEWRPAGKLRFSQQG